MFKGITRQPVVAGTFYYSNADKLREQIAGLFRNIKTQSSSIGVVSPHAGYAYSGQTSAWAIASLKAARTFIVIGPNHNTLGEQFAVQPSGSWETPLGSVRVNSEISRQLMKQCSFLAKDNAAHAMEHSIEVQLPLLKYRFGKNGFDFVPISVTNLDYSDGLLRSCEKLGKAIGMLAKGSQIGIVASSDFSHYLPKDLADKNDKKAVESIMELDTEGLFKSLKSVDASVCGYGPIAVLMSAARAMGLKARLIHKSTSGDATGDFSSVVAYYAIGFE